MESDKIIDEKDLMILDELKVNSKLTTAQISRKLGIPITTVHNRIKRMERNKVISGYTAKLDHEKLGYNITANILISLKTETTLGKKIDQEIVAKKIKNIPNVESIELVTGPSDIIARINVKDVSELNSVITKKIWLTEGIDKTRTMIVMKRLEE